MSQAEIRVGTQVVCINGDWSWGYHPDDVVPYLNQILTVRGILADLPNREGFAYLRFEEIVNPPRLRDIYGKPEEHEEAFWSANFRPCKKTDISVFKHNLVPMRDEVLV